MFSFEACFSLSAVVTMFVPTSFESDRRDAQYGRTDMKYTISTIDTTLKPMNRPSRPPVLAVRIHIFSLTKTTQNCNKQLLITQKLREADEFLFRVGAEEALLVVDVHRGNVFSISNI